MNATEITPSLKVEATLDSLQQGRGVVEHEKAVPRYQNMLEKQHGVLFVVQPAQGVAVASCPLGGRQAHGSGTGRFPCSSGGS